MHIQNKKRFVLMMGLLGLLIILIGFSIWMIGSAISSQNGSAKITSNPTNTATADSAQGNRTDSTANQAITEPMDTLVLVNKTTSLAEDYQPADLVWVDLPGVRETQLRKEAAGALEELFAAAESKICRYTVVPAIDPIKLRQSCTLKMSKPMARKKLIWSVQNLAKASIRPDWLWMSPPNPLILICWKALDKRQKGSSSKTMPISMALLYAILRTKRRSPVTLTNPGICAMWVRLWQRKSTTIS